MLNAGSEIGGIKLEQLLGRGAMGEVYRGIQLSLKRPVAVKRIADHLLNEPEAVQRFEREAQCVARLHSPNVVQVFDFIQAADATGKEHCLIVMELIEGGMSLRDAQKLHGVLSWQQAASLAMQAAEGLAAAAEFGVIHRDVKPDNIMLSKRGVAKLADFGLARAVDSTAMTQEGALLGTPNYIAPESCRGESVDHRADLYSLGATWYHLATGRPPFQGQNLMALLRAHLEDEPTPVTELAPDTPSQIASLIHACLAKNPDARPASAQALSERIQALVGEGLHVPRTVPELIVAQPAAAGTSDDDTPGATLATQVAADGHAETLPTAVADPNAATLPTGGVAASDPNAATLPTGNVAASDPNAATLPTAAVNPAPADPDATIDATQDAIADHDRTLDAVTAPAAATAISETATAPTAAPAGSTPASSPAPTATASTEAKAGGGMMPVVVIVVIVVLGIGLGGYALAGLNSATQQAPVVATHATAVGDDPAGTTQPRPEPVDHDPVVADQPVQPTQSTEPDQPSEPVDPVAQPVPPDDPVTPAEPVVVVPDPGVEADPVTSTTTDPTPIATSDPTPVTTTDPTPVTTTDPTPVTTSDPAPVETTAEDLRPSAMAILQAYQPTEDPNLTILAEIHQAIQDDDLVMADRWLRELPDNHPERPVIAQVIADHRLRGDALKAATLSALNNQQFGRAERLFALVQQHERKLLLQGLGQERVKLRVAEQRQLAALDLVAPLISAGDWRAAVRGLERIGHGMDEATKAVRTRHNQLTASLRLAANKRLDELLPAAAQAIDAGKDRTARDLLDQANDPALAADRLDLVNTLRRRL